jgi:signal transduction histidine kinase
LLRNAFAYGAADQPVRLRATSGGGEFELSVANAGDPIPPELQARLFEPYTHGTDRPGRHVVGLGLHVAAAIAQAHGGQLSFSSSPEGTCFTFRMKLA